MDTRRLRAGRRLDLPVPALVGGHTDPRRCSTTPHHTDPRRCTHAARQPIQGHAIVVTHTFHAQEPTEPRVGKVAASSIKWKSAGREGYSASVF